MPVAWLQSPVGWTGTGCDELTVPRVPGAPWSVGSALSCWSLRGMSDKNLPSTIPESQVPDSHGGGAVGGGREFTILHFHIFIYHDLDLHLSGAGDG